LFSRRWDIGIPKTHYLDTKSQPTAIKEAIQKSTRLLNSFNMAGYNSQWDFMVAEFVKDNRGMSRHLMERMAKHFLREIEEENAHAGCPATLAYLMEKGIWEWWRKSSKL
jgi:hypothetical protein